MKISHLVLIIALAGTVCACSSEEEKQFGCIAVLEKSASAADPTVLKQTEQLQKENEESRKVEKEESEINLAARNFMELIVFMSPFIYFIIYIWIALR